MDNHGAPRPIPNYVTPGLLPRVNQVHNIVHDWQYWRVDGKGKMVPSIKVLAAKPSDLSLTFRTCVVEGKNRLLQGVLWPPRAYCGIRRATQRINKCHTVCKWRNTAECIHLGYSYQTCIVFSQESSKVIFIYQVCSLISAIGFYSAEFQTTYSML